MTAPEPTPTAEHIDAVARTMQPGAWKFSAAMSKERARIDARRLLTTTDADAISALAASLPAEVKIASLTDAEMLAALVDRGNDEEIRRRLELATGRNGLRLLAQIRDEGLDVIRVTPEQVAP